METYSIYTGTDIESTSFDLSDETQFESILYRLEDNNLGEINPVDIRDAMLSLYSNSAFKETTTNSLYYIGVDTGNPDPLKKDLKNKILIGKKSYSGTYSYLDTETMQIMDGLTTSDTDIFFYNTKEDSVQQDETKIGIFSGSDTSLFVPYISTQYVSVSDSLTFNIINQNKIKINSDSSRVSINNIGFPTLSEASLVTDGQIIKYSGTYSNGYLELTDNNIYYIGSIGSTSSELNIYGSSVSVNGYDLEFTDDRLSSVEIGDVVFGESFDSNSISELLKRVIYTYHPPTGSIRLLEPFDSGYVEVGTYPSIDLEFTINKKSLPTSTTALTNMLPNVYDPILTSGYETIIGTYSGIVISPIGFATQSYSITVNDGVESNSDSVDLIGILPYFSGIGISNNPLYSGMFLNKLVEGKSDKEIQIMGSGNIYYIYPQEYGSLFEILDEFGNNIILQFSQTVFNFSSPSGYWASQPYYIYKSNNTYTYTTPVIITFKV